MSKRNKVEEVIKLYNELSGFSPANIEALDLMADLMLDNQRYNDATYFVTKGLESDRGNPKRWNRLAQMYVGLGQKQEAEAAYVTALKKSNNHYVYVNGYAQLLINDLRYDKAENIFLKGLKDAESEAYLLPFYALFQAKIRRDVPRAKILFLTALKYKDSEFYIRNLKMFAEFLESLGEGKVAKRYRMLAEEREDPGFILEALREREQKQKKQ